MASITRCGTCVPPGPSRNAAGCPLTVCERAGNWERPQVRSRVVEIACSVVGIVIYFLLELCWLRRKYCRLKTLSYECLSRECHHLGFRSLWQRGEHPHGEF